MQTDSYLAMRNDSVYFDLFFAISTVLLRVFSRCRIILVFYVDLRRQFYPITVFVNGFRDFAVWFFYSILTKHFLFVFINICDSCFWRRLVVFYLSSRRRFGTLYRVATNGEIYVVSVSILTTLVHGKVVFAKSLFL